ncbi:MAG: ribonuclease HII [Limnohabitans sp.]
MPLKKSLLIKQTLFNWDSPSLVAGVDEAGRGPLAGPVFAAAVILDDLIPNPGYVDSKKLTAKQRNFLYEDIKANALAFCVAQATVEEIDQSNILQATLLAMRRAVKGLRLKPGKVLVDGNRIPVLDIRAEAIIKGDANIPCISAASILAKVERDNWCESIDSEFPGYGFAKHKGYGTAEHLNALTTLGPTCWHRKSFAPVAKRLNDQSQG